MSPEEETRLALAAFRAWAGGPIAARASEETLERYPGVWEAVVRAVCEPLAGEVEALRRESARLQDAYVKAKAEARDLRLQLDEVVMERAKALGALAEVERERDLALEAKG